jgi:hypothetical protein
METNISKQLYFLVEENSGTKLEKVIEQILESNIYNVSDFLKHKNVKAVNIYLFNNKIVKSKPRLK